MNQTTIEIITGALGVYEIFARSIPTTKNWSIIHKIFSVLHFASGFLNRKKPGVPTSTNMNAIILIVASALLFSCSTLKRTQIDCLSKKDVHITLIDKHGNPYTFHSTYCDSIRVDVLPDSTKVKQ